MRHNFLQQFYFKFLKLLNFWRQHQNIVFIFFHFNSYHPLTVSNDNDFDSYHKEIIVI